MQVCAEQPAQLQISIVRMKKVMSQELKYKAAFRAKLVVLGKSGKMANMLCPF